MGSTYGIGVYSVALVVIETKKAKQRYCNTERFLYFDIWPSAYVCFITKAVFAKISAHLQGLR